METNVTTGVKGVKRPVLLPVSGDTEIQKKQITEINLPVLPPDNRIVIPRLNKNVPIVAVSSENLLKGDFSALEKDIQQSLKYGVVHYPKTAWPGEKGNVFITGHSSYYVWDDGQFKDVFALLHQVKMDDLIEIYYRGEKYVYKVYDIQTIKPDKVDVLSQPDDYILTLMTCTPVGTNWNRLIVKARQIEGPKK